MMTNYHKLDDIDHKILAILSQNARISNLQLAEKVNISPTPCARRVQQLEKIGIIKAYRATLDYAKLGMPLSVFIAISMDKHTKERFECFEKAIQSFEEVVSCSIIVGRSEDFLIKVVVRDMAHYEEFLLNHLNQIDGICQVHSSFEMRQIF